jgi:hypothetical protein
MNLINDVAPIKTPMTKSSKAFCLSSSIKSEFSSDVNGSEHSQ